MSLNLRIKLFKMHFLKLQFFEGTVLGENEQTHSVIFRLTQQLGKYDTRMVAKT